MENQLYYLLDVGSTLMKFTIFSFVKNNLITLNSFIAKTEGIENGEIVDEENFKKVLSEFLGAIKKQSDNEFQQVLLLLPSVNLGLYKNHSTSKVANNNTVSSLDIESLHRSFAKIKLSDELEVISIYPTQFLLDGTTIYQKPPYGVHASSIQLTCNVIALPKNIAHSYVRIVESCGIGIQGIVTTSCANVRSTLYDDEIEQGAFLIDIGGHSTSITFVYQNVISGFTRMEYGGENITLSIAQKLAIDYDVAEELKVRYGSATLQMNGNDPIYYDHNSEQYLFENDVNQIVSECLDTLFEQIKKGINHLVKNESFPFIFTGGGSHIQHLEQKAAKSFARDVRVGKIQLLGVRHNSFASSLGALRDYMMQKQDYDLDLTRIVGEDDQEGMMDRQGPFTA